LHRDGLGHAQWLNDDEICFDDALVQNESAIQAMGIDELKVIAAELVTDVRKSVSIDWTLRESARAKIRVMVRRILNKHGYCIPAMRVSNSPRSWSSIGWLLGMAVSRVVLF